MLNPKDLPELCPQIILLKGVLNLQTLCYVPKHIREYLTGRHFSPPKIHDFCHLSKQAQKPTLSTSCHLSSFPQIDSAAHSEILCAGRILF